MATERRRQILLGLLAIALAFILYRTWTQTSAAPTSASNRRSAPAARDGAPVGSAGEKPSGPSAPDVHLNALGDDRPKPVSGQRNLFRYKPKAPPPPPPAPPVAVVVPQPMPVAPAGPPPPPPITLKFIGVLDQGEGKPKVAILTDGVGPPIYGVEGQPVAGRYRILRIGAESVEMAYLDGRGRQTIRLSGS
jgi:hypothetical protein